MTVAEGLQADNDGGNGDRGSRGGEGNPYTCKTISRKTIIAIKIPKKEKKRDGSENKCGIIHLEIRTFKCNLILFPL